MSDFLSSLWAAIGWSIVWQSTLALAAGLLATVIYRRRPARADGLLVAGVLAALAAPVGTFVVHELGWGVLMPRKAPIAAISPVVWNEEAEPTPLAAPNEASPSALTSTVQIAVDTSSPFAPRKGVLSRSERRPTPPTSWLTLVPAASLAVWLALATAALMRLGGAVWTGRRLLAASCPIRNARIDRALALAAERLRLDVKVEIRVSARVRCPVIWCWSRRPVVLLPVAFVQSTDETAWLGIFCHELAHWKRRDHLSSLAAELLCCIVPWQPLARWARRQHDQLSELACDEWVLACGQSAESYAGSLLDLAPQRGAALALAVVRNPAGLVGRIRHILAIAKAQPALGRRWLVTVAGSTLALIALAALAQQQRPRAKNASSTGAPSDVAKTAQTNAGQLNDQPQKISGVVLDLADKPVAGAKVYWVGLARTVWNTLPHDDPRNGRIDLFAEGLTDELGRFRMSANFEIHAYNFPSVFVRHGAHGLGLRSYMFLEDVEPLEIHLPKARPLRGRILNSSGVPVAGAEVLPVDVESLVRGGWEGSVRLSEAARLSGDLPSFWPQPVKTDADGRFSIPGNDNAGTALLRIVADGFGHHGVNVTEDEAAAEWNKAKPGGRRSPAVANNFALVLEPPRQFEGIVTDAKTGRPIAAVEIVLESTLNSGHLWNRQVARATSDAQGHYRFIVPATGDEQHLRVYPPLGYSPIGARVYLEKKFVELFGNGRVFRNDIQLKPGRVVRGRVIDAESRVPVRDAAVRYRSPNVVRNDYWFSEPVLTNQQGEFKITVVEGPGDISVDTRSPECVRIVPPDVAGARVDVDPHAYAAIDVPAEGEIPPLELAVQRGVDFILEPVEPDGQPVPVVQIVYRKADVPPTHSLRWDIMETPLRLRGCGPGKTYRLLIGARSCELGAVADVIKTFLSFRDDPPPVVDGGGDTEALDLITRNLPYYDSVLPSIDKDTRSTTNANGTFEFQGIVPGVYPYLNLNHHFASGDRYHPAGMIEPGKTLDMGELVVKP